jgi:DNA polymerase III delta prime subunit
MLFKRSIPAPPEPSASILCERGIQPVANGQRPTQTTPYQIRMDAVVQFVTTLPAVKSLLAVTHHDYLPNEYEPIQVDSDLFFQLLELKLKDGAPEIVKFKLMTYSHDVQYLQAFLETCTVDYERRLANKLGTHRYFFDQVVQTKVKGSMQNALPTTHLLYSKAKFTTNRTFANVFFEEREHVQGRTKFFLENRAWYDQKGIPYTLGFMFHGPPGTGKTSCVKAIANEGRRHIINVQLSEIKTKAQLQHLFFNDELHVYNGLNTEKYTIPVSERLYVIEDIDAMGDTVLRREWKKPTPVLQKPKSDEDAWLDRQKESEQEQLDLSFLLNLLDGTLEASGRILIVTTNFPERLDRALIRPGRIDMILPFKKCNRAILQEMASAFYDRPVSIPNDPSLDSKWSPAEVNQILFRNFTDPETAIKELVELGRGDLTGIVENGTDLESIVPRIDE